MIVKLVECQIFEFDAYIFQFIYIQFSKSVRNNVHCQRIHSISKQVKNFLSVGYRIAFHYQVTPISLRKFYEHHLESYSFIMLSWMLAAMWIHFATQFLRCILYSKINRIPKVFSHSNDWFVIRLFFLRFAFDLDFVFFFEQIYTQLKIVF